ncbi:hypothetical protein [Nonlabens antarcticus]|uniref:hypothetical protein n=1 Tax=Nonlabens antarcticus TaxID=392714 RepID=UPI00189106FB|nr:hypothetical protein [Nonlabens antarcticus]
MLKYVVVIIGVLAFAKANSQTTSATASHNVYLNQHPASVAVEEFFEDFHSQDTLSLRNRFIDQASLISYSIKNGKKSTSKTEVSNFLKNIATIPSETSFKEEITEIKILESTDIVSVHASYNFYYNAKKSHKGTNVFTMILINDQ